MMFKRRLWGAALAGSAALVGSLPAHAAPSTADAKVILLQQLSFIDVQDLDFGSIVPATTQGFVTVAPDGTRTNTGALVLASGPNQPARFAGKGTQNQQVLISMGAPTITITGPGAPMQIDQFTIGSTPTAVLTAVPQQFRITAANGIFNFPVGARLRVNANQAPGTYTGTFTITLVYQ